MRWLVIALAALLVVLGLALIVSAFARGLGVTNATVLGVVMVIVGSARLTIEFRRP